MNKQAREALNAYYQEAGSWADDQLATARRSRRTAWIIASVAIGVAAVEALALAALAPLKTVVPYTLLVDRQTGFVQALKPLDVQQIAPTAALTQSFLVQYVIARESFDIDLVQGNYRKVALWSADRARSEYLTSMQVSNAQSPLALYPRSTVVEASVRSVSPLSNGASLVRFETVRRDPNGRTSGPTPYVAVIRYRYSGEPMSVEDRFVNPLGFQVLRYRRDQEALPAAPPATPTAALPTGGSTQPSGRRTIVVGPGRPSTVAPRP
jgi:type IV secretion system protein VirB8